MTDPAVSPFDLIREALECLRRQVRGWPYRVPEGNVDAALDQLQRDHEALIEANDNLRASLELEVASSRHARQKDNAYLIEQRDAAVREAEKLRHRAEYLQAEINRQRRVMQKASTWEQFCRDYAATYGRVVR